VSEALGLQPNARETWMEFDNGPLAGLPFDEAQRRYPIPVFRHAFDPLTRDGGESTMQTRARVLAALQEVWTCGGQHVLVVAHGGILNAALRELLDAPRAWFAFGDTGFATLQLARTSDAVVLTGVNLSPHLEGVSAAHASGT